MDTLLVPNSQKKKKKEIFFSLFATGLPFIKTKSNVYVVFVQGNFYNVVYNFFNIIGFVRE